MPYDLGPMGALDYSLKLIQEDSLLFFGIININCKFVKSNAESGKANKYLGVIYECTFKPKLENSQF